MGPDPNLPPPDSSLLPVVAIAPAVGWPSGATPVDADGLAVAAFARDLDHPRWLYVLPNGDDFHVANTDAHVDECVEPQDPGSWPRRACPSMRLGPHTASLGVVFYTADALPGYAGDAFIARHGSSNRRPLSGYRVIFAPFADGGREERRAMC